MDSKKRLRIGKVVAPVAIAVILIAVTVGIAYDWIGLREGSSSDPPSSTTTASQESRPTVTTTTTGTSSTTTTENTVTTTLPAPTTTTTTKNPDPDHHSGQSARHAYVQSADAPWNLRLANDWNTLPSLYESTMTLEYYSASATREVDQFDSRAIQALRDMINAANNENPSLNLRPVSCFRSAATQARLFNNQVASVQNRHPEYTQAEAEAVAATVVKRPGQSEHNTGLAADLGGSGNYALNEDFANTAAYAWLIEHCADYGFILRFPEGKENITGVIYEPWHYRYVGVEHARYIMDNNLCLEEYLQMKGW